MFPKYWIREFLECLLRIINPWIIQLPNNLIFQCTSSSPNTSNRHIVCFLIFSGSPCRLTTSLACLSFRCFYLLLNNNHRYRNICLVFWLWLVLFMSSAAAAQPVSWVVASATCVGGINHFDIFLLCCCPQRVVRLIGALCFDSLKSKLEESYDTYIHAKSAWISAGSRLGVIHVLMASIGGCLDSWYVQCMTAELRITNCLSPRVPKIYPPTTVSPHWNDHHIAMHDS